MGFEGALYDASILPHRNLEADLVLIDPQMQTLFSVKDFARERLYQTLAYDGVKSVTPVYIATGQWRNPQTRLERAILVWVIFQYQIKYLWGWLFSAGNVIFFASCSYYHVFINYRTSCRLLNQLSTQPFRDTELRNVVVKATDTRTAVLFQSD